MAFDESKIQRDAHGRFSSGMAGFVAKHTGQIPKLEGYEASKAPLAAWVGSKLRSPANTPVEKYAASKREADISFVGMAKEQGKDIKSTGDLERGAARRAWGTDSRWYDSIDRAHTFTNTFIRQARVENEKLDKEARKAQNAHKKAIRARVDNALEIKNHEDRIGRLTSARDLIEASRARVVELTKEKAKIEKKVTSTKQKMDAAYDKLGTANAKYETVRDAAQVMSESVGHALQVHPNKDIKVSVSHDRSDGSIEIHLHGPSEDAEHPGEKELSMLFKPGKTAIKKVGKYGTSFDADKTQPMQVEVRMQFPSSTKGKDHPLTSERSYTNTHSDFHPERQAQTLLDFLESTRKRPGEE